MTSVLWGTQEISQYGLEPSYAEIEVELNGLAWPLLGSGS